MEPKKIQSFWYNGQYYTVTWGPITTTNPQRDTTDNTLERLIEATLSGMTTFPQVEKILEKL